MRSKVITALAASALLHGAALATNDGQAAQAQGNAGTQVGHPGLNGPSADNEGAVSVTGSKDSEPQSPGHGYESDDEHQGDDRQHEYGEKTHRRKHRHHRHRQGQNENAVNHQPGGGPVAGNKDSSFTPGGAGQPGRPGAPGQPGNPGGPEPDSQNTNTPPGPPPLSPPGTPPGSPASPSSTYPLSPPPSPAHPLARRNDGPGGGPNQGEPAPGTPTSPGTPGAVSTPDFPMGQFPEQSSQAGPPGRGGWYNRPSHHRDHRHGKPRGQGLQDNASPAPPTSFQTHPGMASKIERRAQLAEAGFHVPKPINKLPVHRGYTDFPLHQPGTTEGVPKEGPSSPFAGGSPPHGGWGSPADHPIDLQED